MLAAWLLAVLAGAVPFQSKLQALASDESNAFLDRTGRVPTRVDKTIEQRFAGGRETTAVDRLHPRWEARGGRRASSVAADAQALWAKPGVIPDIGPRMITPVQKLGLRRAAPDHAPPQSSVIKADERGRHDTALHAVERATTPPTVVVRDVAAIRAVVPDPAGAEAEVPT